MITEARKKEVEEIFVSIASEYEDCEPIIEELRNLNSCNEITDEEYNYLQAEWDNLLEKYDL
jgi:hypothetical protein